MSDRIETELIFDSRQLTTARAGARVYGHSLQSSIPSEYHPLARVLPV